jgi:hypothetical protein
LSGAAIGGAANYTFSFSTPPIANDDTYPEVVIGNVSVKSSLISFSVLTNDQFNSPVTIISPRGRRRTFTL